MANNQSLAFGQRAPAVQEIFRSNMIIESNVDDKNMGPSYFPSELLQILSLSRLNAVHHYLWMAGRPRPCRPLHRQLMIGREVVVTEQGDLHLLWRGSKIFIKPLPKELLDEAFWTEHLSTNNPTPDDTEIQEGAIGLLLSYSWLIRWKSDLRIARNLGLLPRKMKFRDWNNLIAFLSPRLDRAKIARPYPAWRYDYGELRLFRINLIYRFSPQTISLNSLFRAYMNHYDRYTPFFERNFRWILIVFIYVSIILNAMQVGLATSSLASSYYFQHITSGFALFSIFVALCSLVLGLVVLLCAFVYHFVATARFLKGAVRDFPTE